MTLIPADTKDEKREPSELHAYLAAPPHATTNPFPNPLIQQNQSYSESDFDSEHPPPYTPTDSLSSSSRDFPPIPDVPIRIREVFTGSNIPAAGGEAKLQESNAISASSAVNIIGPLHVLGNVKSSSNVSLGRNIIVDGKVSSSSWILLEDDVRVEGKVDSSGKVTLRNRVKVGEKVDASGSVLIKNGVRVGDKVSASGSIQLDGGEQGISIAGKVAASGHVDIIGWVEIGGDVKSSGHVKIQSFGSEKGAVKIGGKIDCSGGCMVEGDMVTENLFLSGGLKLNGRLHICGDFEAKGAVKMLKGSQLIIDGRRTIHGSIVEVEKF